MNGGAVELHAGLAVTETDRFGAMEDDDNNTDDPASAVSEWLHHGDQEINFLGGDLPHLPDFPCMTSSSSSSSHSMEMSSLNADDCMQEDDAAEPFGFHLDLQWEDKNDFFFDPDSIFLHSNDTIQQEQAAPPPPQQEPEKEEDQGGPDGELSSVFFEWLKTNKDSVSASVLRGVKLNKATVESAAKRLGGGKEAMRRLLKLILEWVQICHLQKQKQRNNVDVDAPSIGAAYSTPNPFNQSPPCYGGVIHNMLPHSHYINSQGDQSWRKLGPLATKEARKKRMARQRRSLSHHRTHIIAPAAHNCTVPPNWVYCQQAMAPAPAPAPPLMPPDRMTVQCHNYHQAPGSSDTGSQLGWKHEKNLKFLLQKVLKQSDVGSLGRIVLPKKEAETHLPELEARDGISIEMEDIGTCRVWNMRYRYWPNNKSRMYLLENTGDFVRANGLQEGDFIVIYSDMKCAKFMIRGVKVRQAGTKAETKKAAKRQKNPHGNTAAANTAGNGANNNGTPSPLQKMGN